MEMSRGTQGWLNRQVKHPQSPQQRLCLQIHSPANSSHVQSFPRARLPAQSPIRPSISEKSSQRPYSFSPVPLAFQRWGGRDSERLTNLPKVTELACDKPEFESRQLDTKAYILNHQLYNTFEIRRNMHVCEYTHTHTPPHTVCFFKKERKLLIYLKSTPWPKITIISVTSLR